jgi:hypothetical protein
VFLTLIAVFLDPFFLIKKASSCGMTWQIFLLQEITQSGAIIWFFLPSGYSNRNRTFGRVKAW